MGIITFILFCLFIIISIYLVEKENFDQYFPQDKDIEDFIKKHTKRYK